MVKVHASIHLGVDLVVAAELVVVVPVAAVVIPAEVDPMEVLAITLVEEDLSILELIRITHLVLMMVMV